MSGPETQSKQFLRYNNDCNYEEYTKLVLLAPIKNVGKTLTPQNTKFPCFLVLGNKYYHRHSETACCIIRGQVTTVKITLKALVWERDR